MTHPRPHAPIGLAGAGAQLRRTPACHLGELAAERAVVVERAQVHGCQELVVLGRRRARPVTR
ncbi:MAG: hypothetical protein KJ792_12740 [Actinobacteria bacterium]|nr:hypothetical protein [Actinomycetota bacterium]MCG2803469.1 hypothetical protein [Cellulomonas sp.]